MKVKELLSVPFTYPNNSVYSVESKDYFKVPKDKHHLFYECNILSLGCGGRGCNGYILIYCDGSYEELVGDNNV